MTEHVAPDGHAGTAPPHLVAAPLAAALAHAAEHVDPDEVADRLRELASRAAEGLEGRPPHPSLPAVGADAVTVFTVETADTAAAMGHPDPEMAVLGSPQISLWFELATNPLMPGRDQGVRHAGVAILVHHLGTAVLGDEVTVRAEVVGASGRTVTFAMDAWQDDVLVAIGTHHRVVLPESP